MTESFKQRFPKLFTGEIIPKNTEVSFIILNKQWVNSEWNNIILWYICGASLVTQTVKNLPAMRETHVQSLGREDLPKGHGNLLQHSCLEIPWTEDPDGLYL